MAWSASRMAFQFSCCMKRPPVLDKFDHFKTKLFSSDREGQDEGYVKVQHQMLEKNTFCRGAAFVSREGAAEEDDGWIITFVHNEDTNISQFHIIDAKKFTDEPIAKITLPCRVPYGFHGAFMSMPLHNRQSSPVQLWGLKICQ